MCKINHNDDHLPSFESAAGAGVAAVDAALPKLISDFLLSTSDFSEKSNNKG